MEKYLKGGRMQTNHILKGEKVQLVAVEADRDARNFVGWRKNSEYLRLMDAGVAKAFSVEKMKKWLEEDELSDENAFFMIRTLEDERLIGEIGLSDFKGNYVNAFVGISIGEPNDWGKGYGSDAMRIILRYAFTILNLHHVSLTVFDYNPRAIRSYEKVGFQYEGVQRQFLNRDGKRWNMHRMGILQREWFDLDKHN
ncbi:MAG: GNAT family N-acetyltransferase [Chloroflexi bacterium HGW-Chloroflexi-10]|nr:MAG: GNAT family N-acetyltransferase [Chloroflexi bacterium HGW-Chloroflexi-10]